MCNHSRSRVAILESGKVTHSQVSVCASYSSLPLVIAAVAPAELQKKMESLAVGLNQVGSGTSMIVSNLTIGIIKDCGVHWWSPTPKVGGGGVPPNKLASDVFARAAGNEVWIKVVKLITSLIGKLWYLEVWLDVA